MPEVIWPVKPIQDKDGNPFYPKGHAKATVCTDGLTVEQHLAGLEGFATATPSGDGYTIDTDFVFREGSKVTVKFTDASVADQPFITLSDGINYPIMKSNGGSAKITAGSYVSLICGTNSFILSGEGGEYGTATSTEVLAGFTLGTENGVVDGSIPIITGTGADSNKIDTEQGIAGALDGDSINYAYLAIQPNSFYKNVSWVRKPEPDLISACIAKGATILGVQGSASVIDTSTATATAADIILGKTAGVNGNMVTGTIPSKEAETIVPTTTNKVIAAGQYLAGDQIVVGDANFVEANIKHGITMFGKTGTFTNDGTLAANKMLSGVIGYSKGTKFTGTIASKGATTITPKTTNQTISSGVYLSGNITILGSSNLIASNIKSGVNIFGVIGSMVDGNISGKTMTLAGSKKMNGYTVKSVDYNAYEYSLMALDSQTLSLSTNSTVQMVVITSRYSYESTYSTSSGKCNYIWFPLLNASAQLSDDTLKSGITTYTLPDDISLTVGTHAGIYDCYNYSALRTIYSESAAGCNKCVSINGNSVTFDFHYGVRTSTTGIEELNYAEWHFLIFV